MSMPFPASRSHTARESGPPSAALRSRSVRGRERTVVRACDGLAGKFLQSPASRSATCRLFTNRIVELRSRMMASSRGLNRVPDRYPPRCLRKPDRKESLPSCPGAPCLRQALRCEALAAWARSIHDGHGPIAEVARHRATPGSISCSTSLSSSSPPLADAPTG